MGIVKKTKQERKDTPLETSPNVEAPVTDLKTALADINTRSAARQTAINESRAKVNANRIERSKQKKSAADGSLFGLASFKGTTGK
jgi:hypothetical protein